MSRFIRFLLNPMAFFKMLGWLGKGDVPLYAEEIGGGEGVGESGTIS